MADIKKKAKTTNPFETIIEALFVFFEKKINMYAFIVLAVGFLVVFPNVSSRFTQEIMTNLFFYVVVCLGLNIIVGYAGLLHLGYAAFFAVGAYTTGILSSRMGMDFWLTIPFSIVAAVIAGLAIGFPDRKSVV